MSKKTISSYTQHIVYGIGGGFLLYGVNLVTGQFIYQIKGNFMEIPKIDVTETVSVDNVVKFVIIC